MKPDYRVSAVAFIAGDLMLVEPPVDLLYRNKSGGKFPNLKLGTHASTGPFV